MKTILLSLFALCCFGQGQQNMTETGMRLAQGAIWRFPESSYAALPAAASGNAGWRYTVTDCLTSACAAGGGSIAVDLRSDGSSWKAISGTGGGVSAYGTLSDGAPIAWDVGTTPNGVVTLGHLIGTRGINLTGLASGGFYVIIIKQDSTGGAAIMLGTGCTWKIANGGGGAVALSTAANAVDILSITYDGTNCYATFAPNFN